MIRTNKYIVNAPENTTFNGDVNVRYTPHDMELYSRQKEKLTFPKHKWWYDAIVNDDLPTIKDHLQTSSAEEKSLLLNGRFESFKDLDDDLDDTDDFGYDCLRELNAFSLATAYLASEETLLELLSHGVDLEFTKYTGQELRTHHDNPGATQTRNGGLHDERVLTDTGPRSNGRPQDSAVPGG